MLKFADGQTDGHRRTDSVITLGQPPTGGKWRGPHKEHVCQIWMHYLLAQMNNR